MLQTKLSALERAYERQAAQHEQLYTELNMLQHQSTPVTSVQQARSVTVRSRFVRATVLQFANNHQANAAVHHDPTMASCSRRHQPTSPQVAASPPRHHLQQHVRHRHQRDTDWLHRRPPGTRVFRALYEYLPARDSPNDNPDSELSMAVDDMLIVHGDMDEDMFYDAENVDGERGLVPSNYVQPVDIGPPPMAPLLDRNYAASTQTTPLPQLITHAYQPRQQQPTRTTFNHCHALQPSQLSSTNISAMHQRFATLDRNDAPAPPLNVSAPDTQSPDHCSCI